MGRRFDLRDPAILVAVVAAALTIGIGALLGLALSGNRGAVTGAPVTATSLVATSAQERAQAEEVPATSAISSTSSASEQRPSRAERDAAVSQSEGQESEETRVVVPGQLRAGDVVSEADIEAAGGTDAFFFAEEVPDEVFDRMEGKSFGADCTVPLSDLRYVRVLHVTAEGERTVGELVVHRNVAGEVVDIFRQLYEAGYPIHKMHLVDDYDASDDASISDDNTSSFNYRLIAGTDTLSNHAYGLAIDINPFENPYITGLGNVVPPEAERYADRTLTDPYVLHTDDLCYELFTAYGWGWGGAWPSPIDYQHFEKPDALWE